MIVWTTSWSGSRCNVPQATGTTQASNPPSSSIRFPPPCYSDSKFPPLALLNSNAPSTLLDSNFQATHSIPIRVEETSHLRFCLLRLSAQLALLNTAPCSSCDNGNFAAQRYFRRDERCEACGNQTILIVLVLIFLIFLVILAYYASKTNFNFAAISISINFFQASAQLTRSPHPPLSKPPHPALHCL